MVAMVRAIALTSMAGLFLLISSELRASVWNGFATMVHGIEAYSPVSYVGLVAAIVIGFLFYVRTASVQR